MAGLLSKIKKGVTPEVKVAKDLKQASTLDLTKILKNPRITEKAAHLSEANVYTFNVYPRATKPEIKKAIESLYGVKVERVTVITLPQKSVSRKTGKGVKGGGKKAYVYLQKGQTIEFV